MDNWNLNLRITKIIENINGLPKGDKQELTEFLEHDEWGIALEHLCATVLEEEINISSELFYEIREVGEKIEIDCASWEELKHLII
ncbi:MafI family immunity protein [Bacillus sp. RG28]|uniref:MafI family immunity protein n=1 Tax=Gottfriedia endophytica TaxID=2820819 RepID=A0A940NGZ4_9BACI|nr:MafI family immunity protein [Gottfriedia endophytica]MBP0724075.1 MafI family immunity protein [Gottfriedia endophytica]